MFTTYFGQYGHHQVLKYLVGELLLFYCAGIAYVVPLMRTRVVLGVSCSLLFFVASLQHNKIAAVSPLDILTPDDGHIGQTCCEH
jgi:hypothetical protein